MDQNLLDLPENVRQNLVSFVTTTKEICGDNLISIILFGSAAEGRLRPTSDVNLIVLTRRFDISQIDLLREPLRVAYAAVRLQVMLLLESELSDASEAFAVKFTDILHRNRILFGSDPFRKLEISRTATLQRLKQVIMHLTLRIRERYALVSLREEQLTSIIADITGPMRSIAASILSLEGKPGLHPKEALQVFTKQLPAPVGNQNSKDGLAETWSEKWQKTLENMSMARERRELKSGQAASTLLTLLELLQEMQKHIQGLR